jgi:alpha-tubulin suppressor-like RCC1 family protein
MIYKHMFSQHIHKMAVAAGEEHTVVVGEDGSAFAFGSNAFGQLGIGNNTKKLAPTRLPLSGPVRQVAAGYAHTGIVTDAGDLLMCGGGRKGNLGLGDTYNRLVPTLVPRAVFDGESVLMVACGNSHTVVATEGGGVYTFGRGDCGQLGHGDEEDQIAPRRVPEAAFRPNGSAEGPGERIVMVAVGIVHTVALSEAGHVFTWGHSGYGQLGHGDREKQWAPRQVETRWFGGDRVVFVAADGTHTVSVTAGGRLYTWGDGGHGQLGHGDTYNRLAPTLVGGFGGAEGGRVGGFGGPEGGQVVMAACGRIHTLVVTHDGALWACGGGRRGRLGLNHQFSRHAFERLWGTTFGGARVVAAAADDLHSAAVTEDGALWTWGGGGSGRLGHGDENTRFAPTRVDLAGFGNLRIGRCRVLPKAHALAFLMGTKRQGQGTVTVKKLAGEVSLVPMICRWCTTVLPGMAGRMEGLMRLCGGFHAWKLKRVVMGQ